MMLLRILICLLVMWCCSADAFQVQGRPAPGGITSDPCSGYLMCENFETAYTWAEGLQSGIIINEQYATSPAPIDGSYSLFLSDPGNELLKSSTTYTLSSSEDEIYIFFKIHFTSLGDTTTCRNFFNLVDGADGLSFYLSATNNYVSSWDGYDVISTTAISSGTTYNIWIHFRKYVSSPLSYEVIQVYVSTGAKPETPIINSSNRTYRSNNITETQFEVRKGIDFIIDKFVVSSNDITGVP